MKKNIDENINALKEDVQTRESIDKSGDSAIDSTNTASIAAEDADKTNKKSGKERMKAFFNSAWDYIKFAKIELIIIVGAVFLDLLSKFLINKHMSENETDILINNFLQFHYVLNKNAAFGSAFGLDKLLGEKGIRIFFIIFSTITVSIFCYLMYHFRNRGYLIRISIAMVIGGAFGNLYDRIAFGYVRDFVEIVFFGYDVPLLGRTFAIFNIADASLVIGMILLMVFFIFKYSPKEEKDKKDKSETDKKETDKAKE